MILFCRTVIACAPLLVLGGCLDLGDLVDIEKLKAPVVETGLSTDDHEPQIIEVRIDDLAFDPDTIEIKVGDTVRWIMLDSGTFHFVVEGAPRGAEPSFDSPRLDVGDSWDLTFDEPGEFVYHCSNHSTVMRNATVTVTE